MTAHGTADDTAHGTEPGEHVILVDANDREIGAADKLAAHRDGVRHRAFSVFVFDHRGAMLLQRRAATKYHSGGLWSNACCGHPRPGESTGAAAHRRLREEMGFDCALVPVFAFTYRADLGGGLSEHEIDHVFVGQSDVDPKPSPEEVSEWTRIDVAALRDDVAAQPAHYTVWFRLVLDRLLSTSRGAAVSPPDD